jgi:RND family efflux transporter MFP subunit
VPGALLALDLPRAHGAGILGVRVWPAPDYTRVTLELDASLKSAHFVITDPPRLVVDLEGVDIDAALREIVAKVQADELRLSYTRVVAPDDGIISARNATVGSLAQQGQELFRLIRGGRLEWRAEVVAADISRVKTGLPASLTTPSGQAVQGKVRMVAPTVDPQTRTALVYVDLPAQAMAVGARAGMFARGSFELGKTSALTLPQTAVLQREGFSYAFRVGPDGRVVQIKVDVGRRIGDRVEIASGLTPETRVIASGVGFLADGDLVRVVDAPLASAEQKK